MGDSSKPNPPGARPDSSRPEEPAQRPGPHEGEQEGRPVDFGSYVSSTVRSSAELFGTPARQASSRSRSTRSAPPARRQPPAPAETPYDEPGEPVSTPRRDRPSRYWRDSVEPGAPLPPGGDGDGDGGDDGGPRAPWAFSYGERPGWAILAAIAVTLLAIALLIWLLNRDDGGGDTPTPTPTQQQVIDTAPTTEGAGGQTPPPFLSPTEEPTPTEGVQRGGDNQRDRDDSTPGADGSDPLASIELGPVARECPERCLVRIADVAGVDDLLAQARTRPSFTGDDWLWAIATPEGIAWLEQHTETTLVTDSPDTLALYVAKVPGDETAPERATNLGTVIDEAGQWRVIEAARVPANVKPLTDWGWEVDKMAPAPPLEAILPEEPTALASIEIGALIDDVSSDSIDRSITDLVAVGDTDGNGLGTRYYTTTANSQAAEYLFNRLESYGLRVWYEDFLSWEGYLMVNVIGEVPGDDDSEIYGVMAHFDTLGKDITDAPGADDNATGVAASLEIARILSGYELNHPMRVVFVNVEEVGIVGSRHFAQDAREQGVPYKGIYNLDSIGAQRQYNYMVVNGNADTAWMTDLFRRINAAYGLGQVINAQQSDEIVADDNRLRENGIPSLMVARELYAQSPYHHRPTDIPDTVRVEGVVSCAQLTLLSLAELVKA